LDNFILNTVTLRRAAYKGRDAIELTLPVSANQDPSRETLIDRDFMAWSRDVDFSDGVIELSVASVLADHAPPYARGFIGVAFRIDEQHRFESVYLRPTNSRVDDQVRRNRSVQYVAYPEYTFPRLRTEEPGKYETYVDLPLEEWINLRLEVAESAVRLFVNGSKQPVFVVTDLKLGPAQHGGIGLWIEAGTVGYFADLVITSANSDV
jgi:hypothetical protein